MKTELKNLPKNAKVWIYTAEKNLTDAEQKEIKQQGDKFLLQWESHGTKIPGALEIFYNRFIVVAADEQNDKLCGRAIDSSIQFIKKLENSLTIQLTNRMLIPFIQNNKVLTLPLNEFRELVENGQITNNTIVFNNLVDTLDKFNNEWEVPLSQSWHKQLV